VLTGAAGTYAASLEAGRGTQERGDPHPHGAATAPQLQPAPQAQGPAATGARDDGGSALQPH
jgi:hypothetical protein